MKSLHAPLHNAPPHAGHLSGRSADRFSCLHEGRVAGRCGDRSEGQAVGHTLGHASSRHKERVDQPLLDLHYLQHCNSKVNIKRSQN